MTEDTAAHWEQVYQTKGAEQMSWTQTVPQTSLDYIRSFNLPKTARIIDVGGGENGLAASLLDEGFTNVTVLDISAAAIERAKKLLGDSAGLVTWIVGDVTQFEPEEGYDLWHDRAVFHFMTTKQQRDDYLQMVNTAVHGYLVIATFSDTGPERCSGLPVCRYSEADLTGCFSANFSKLRCHTEDHVTPFGTRQNFIYCAFKRNQQK